MASKKNADIFDFGFTAVNESELEAVQQAKDVEQSVEVLQHKLDRLHKAIIPLLSNLKKNPEKDYIHWPNRVQKVEEFEAFISSIVGD